MLPSRAFWLPVPGVGLLDAINQDVRNIIQTRMMTKKYGGDYIYIYTIIHIHIQVYIYIIVYIYTYNHIYICRCSKLSTVHNPEPN